MLNLPKFYRASSGSFPCTDGQMVVANGPIRVRDLLLLCYKVSCFLEFSSFHYYIRLSEKLVKLASALLMSQFRGMNYDLFCEAERTENLSE